MGSLSSNLAPMSNRRRSQRVLLRVPVSVEFAGPDKQPIVEATHTLVVSAHGGLLYFKAKVSIGRLVTVKNPDSKEEQACRVVYVNTQLDKSEVGIEFMKPAPTFWRVAFPPSDWVPCDPETTAAGF
jgi:PilZ domain